MYANIELLSKINDRIQIPFLPKCSLKSIKIASEVQLMYTSVGDSDYIICCAQIRLPFVIEIQVKKWLPLIHCLRDYHFSWMYNDLNFVTLKKIEVFHWDSPSFWYLLLTSCIAKYLQFESNHAWNNMREKCSSYSTRTGCHE